MTSTQRINKYIDEFVTYDTRVLCSIYNGASCDCLFNNYNAHSVAYAKLKAAQWHLTDRENAMYIDYTDKYMFHNGKEWIDVM